MTTKALFSTLGIGTILLTGCNTEPVALKKSPTPVQVETPAMAITAPQNTKANSTESSITEKPDYLNYTDELYASLLGKKPFALFFHAQWCPTCRDMEKDITSQLATFPEGTKIVKIDYDNSAELKKKYGIVSQSIIIFFNKKGEVVEKLVGPSSEKVKAAVQKSFM